MRNSKPWFFAVFGGPKFAKAPASKLQAPEKLQTATSNPASSAPQQAFAILRLVLLWSLEVGAWCFDFSPLLTLRLQRKQRRTILFNFPLS
jgi:hypothetical protein